MLSVSEVENTSYQRFLSEFVNDSDGDGFQRDDFQELVDGLDEGLTLNLQTDIPDEQTMDEHLKYEDMEASLHLEDHELPDLDQMDDSAFVHHLNQEEGLSKFNRTSNESSQVESMVSEPKELPVADFGLSTNRPGLSTRSVSSEDHAFKSSQYSTASTPKNTSLVNNLVNANQFVQGSTQKSQYVPSFDATPQKSQYASFNNTPQIIHHAPSLDATPRTTVSQYSMDATPRNASHMSVPSSFSSAFGINNMLVEARNECQSLRALNEKLLKASEDYRQQIGYLELEKDRMLVQCRMEFEETKQSLLVFLINVGC